MSCIVILYCDIPVVLPGLSQCNPPIIPPGCHTHPTRRPHPPRPALWRAARALPVNVHPTAPRAEKGCTVLGRQGERGRGGSGGGACCISTGPAWGRSLAEAAWRAGGGAYATRRHASHGCRPRGARRSAGEHAGGQALTAVGTNELDCYAAKEMGANWIDVQPRKWKLIGLICSQGHGNVNCS